MPELVGIENDGSGFQPSIDPPLDTLGYAQGWYSSGLWPEGLSA